MQCKDVELVLEQEGFSPLPESARAHVVSCSHCQGFVADLLTIVSAAHELPAELEPPARVWVSLQAQLESERIIKIPASPSTVSSAPWWQDFGELFRSRTLATAALGLVIVFAAVFQLRQPTDPNTYNSPTSPDTLPALQQPLNPATAKVLIDEEGDLNNMHLAGTSPVDDSLRVSLQRVDAFIAECELHLRANPQDDLAREYLMNAYQQKAELLSAMMDREGSSH